MDVHTDAIPSHKSTYRPQASDALPKILLRSARVHNHPWIFQKMIAKAAENESKPKNGSLVEVWDSEGTWVGRGIYNGHSRVALRLLTEDPEIVLDESFFADKIYAAKKLRHQILNIPAVTDAYRLIHSEGDGLSGLVVDRFADMLVMEYFSSGMYRLRPMLEKLLLKEFPGSRLYHFAEEHIQKQESVDIRSPQKPTPFQIQEHGLRFQVAPGSKHKTGFFVDQRENRQLLSELTRLSPGGRVLDICCNSGGFAVYAKARGAAGEVVGIDLDETVLELAETNAKLNDVKIRYIQVDLFHWLREAIATKSEMFDTVILDPAKQTRSKEEQPKALRKYTDMNRLAMQVVKPGGLLLTCSCTGLVSEAEFLDSIRRAAFQAGRQVQILKVTGAGGDHPWMSHVAEGRYLKAVWARVL